MQFRWYLTVMKIWGFMGKSNGVNMGEKNWILDRFEEG